MQRFWNSNFPLNVGLVIAGVTALQFAPAYNTEADAASVTACSRYGKGCITAPVRRTRTELQVRFPGGTWVGCAGDCREKLRDESLDFWDTHKPENGRGGGRR